MVIIDGTIPCKVEPFKRWEVSLEIPAHDFKDDQVTPRSGLARVPRADPPASPSLTGQNDWRAPATTCRAHHAQDDHHEPSYRLHYDRYRYISSHPPTPAASGSPRLAPRQDNWEVSIDVLNLFDSNDRDIEYYYESRLPGEAAGVNDIHYQPMEPRQIRCNFLYRF